MLADLVTFVGTIAGLSSPIKAGVLPSSPDRVICLREYFGEMSEQQFGSASLKFEAPRLQVVVRGDPDDYETAAAEARVVYLGVGAVQAQTLSGTFYHRIRPLTPPFLLRLDGNRRPEIVFNCAIDKDV